MYETDILIIGAGVVGLAAARELSGFNENIIVVEKEDSFGRETSSRNSEVIHSGIYYPPGSLKARTCVNGRELLYEFCAKYKIPHRKTGKIIVAVSDEDIKHLNDLFINGTKNGVSGLKILDERDIKEVEPNVSAQAALYSPETGIIDSHQFMQSMMNHAKKNGAIFAFNAEVKSVGKTGGYYNIAMDEGQNRTRLKARVVINSAGLDSDSVAGFTGMDIKKNKYELHYCKGSYFRVNHRKAGMLEHLVYPVPNPGEGGLGIHATPDMGGGLRLGPDHEYPADRVKDYTVDNSKHNNFYNAVKSFLPFIGEDDISPDTAGIRPKLQERNGAFRDFVISEESDKGLQGFINLIGIESPGLTAALAIAKDVADMVKKI